MEFLKENYKVILLALLILALFYYYKNNEKEGFSAGEQITLTWNKSADDYKSNPNGTILTSSSSTGAELRSAKGKCQCPSGQYCVQLFNSGSTTPYAQPPNGVWCTGITNGAQYTVTVP